LADRQTKVTLIAAVNGYITDMKRAQDSTAKVGDEAAKSAAKLEKQHQAMTEVGAGIAAIGAVAAVAFGLAVAKFAEFDQAMSNVQAATQESAENMSLLREAALEAGASTVFSATEAANAIEELGKAGLTTEQILGGGLAGALDLAAAGQLEVADAAGIAAIALKQFNLEGEDIPHVADLLAAGAGKAVGDVEDLSAALGQVGLVANGAGQSIEDTTGTLAAFADAGLLGSDAGTSLKAALIALQAPTDKARGIMEEYNLSFYDTNGQMLAFDEIAGQLDENLGSLTDETRNAALAQIFGNDALRVANVLYDEGADGIRKYIDQTNDSGYAAKVAADRLNNLTGDVEKLGGAIDTALIKSGSGVNDLLRGVTQGATGIVDAIGSIPEPVLGVATQITGIVAAVGLVGGAALLAVPKIAQFKLAMSTLNISGASAARGIGLATGALALAGTAFSIWAQRQAEATATASEFEESLDQTTGAVTDYTRELVAKKLAEAGAFDGAKNAGISQKELTDKILEGGDAVEDLRQKLYDYANGNPFDPAIANSVNAVNDLSGGLERADKNLEDQAAAAGESADKTTDAATSYQDAADKAAELQSNLRELIDTINEANGIGQDAVSTNAAYQSALAGISDEVDRQKEAFIDLQKKAFQEANGTLDGFVGTLEGFTLTLDETTESGSANAAMLSDVAAKAIAAADAQLEVDSRTVGADKATATYLGTLEAQRQAFIDSAAEAGFNAEEVQKLADKVFALPDEKAVHLVAETAAAATTIDNFMNRYGTLKGSIVYRATREGGAGDGTAGGFAGGGEIPGTPSRKDNVLIHAATGEFVVNTDAAQRNKALLHYINSGGRIRGYADGGEVQPQYAPVMPRWASGGGGGGASVNVTQNIAPPPNVDPILIGRAAAHTLEFELRRSA
jgi:TP901 family phage tail tape measure protein